MAMQGTALREQRTLHQDPRATGKRRVTRSSNISSVKMIVSEAQSYRLRTTRIMVNVLMMKIAVVMRRRILMIMMEFFPNEPNTRV